MGCIDLSSALTPKLADDTRPGHDEGDRNMSPAIVRPFATACRRSLASGLAAALFLMFAAPLQAGPIFFAGELKDGKFVPGADASQGYCVRYSTASVNVEDGKASVTVEDLIDGHEKEVQMVCIIPLPAGADGSDVRVTLGAPGSRPTILGDATFLSSAKAQEVYEAVAKGSGSNQLLAYSGHPAILVPSVRLQGKMQMVMSFNTPVRVTQGVSSLICPLPASAWSKAPIDRMALTVNLRTKEPLRSVFSPTHNANITRKGLTEATATVKADHWSGLDEFRLFWVADKDDLGLRVLAHRGSGKEDGFFMLLGNPTGSAVEKVVEKDILFVLDTSGSMRGEKMEQARSAIDYCLEHINSGDRFNVITFGTAVTSFRDELVAADKTNVAAAREFVENVVANGQTNISGAMAKALEGKADPSRPRIMMFLTDGAPTVGERVPEKIVDQVKKINTNGTKVFVMGVGNDVNAHLLDRLAEVTDGSSEFVAPREELDAKIAGLYDRLSHPVLSGVRVSFGDMGAKSVLPSKLPVLFKGSEIMMVGRYKEGGKQTITISGTLSGKPTKYTCEIDLPRAKDAKGSDNEFLAPLWAARQIGYLLQEIRLHGGDKELIAEVVRLSHEYGIVTEYTSFVAMGGARGGAAGKDMMYKEAESRLRAARSEQAGAWAVNQAANDKALQRAMAPSAAQSYRDRRGQVVTAAQTVTQIGSRTFYLQDGQWSDAEEAGKRKTRVVKLFSPEYFELLKTDATFAKAQQLGWALSMNVGEERIVIEKDGKQKDAELQKRSQQNEFDPFENQFPGKSEQQIRPGRPGLPNKDLQQIPNRKQLIPEKEQPNRNRD
jgi:Ca-activated chloride channel family protein